MFGYLRLNRHGLSRPDRGRYNAHFCASCHGLAAAHGRLSSLLTSYDQTFLQIVFSALDERESNAPQRLPCTVVPFRRVLVQPVSPPAKVLLAALNMALVEAKAVDDATDEGSARSRIAAALLSRQACRAHARLEEAGFPVDLIRHLGAAQLEAERAPAPTLATLSAPTGTVLAEIFGFAATLARRPEHVPDMRSLGEALGRFIYVFDALDDLEADQRTGRFNALVASLGLDPDRTEAWAFLDDALRQVAHRLATLPLGERRALTDGVLRELRRRLDAAISAHHRGGRTCSGPCPTSEQGLRGVRWHRGPAGFCDCDCGSGDCGCHDASHCCGLGDCCHCGSCFCDGLDCCCTAPSTDVRGGVSRTARLLLLVVILALVALILYYATRPSTPPAAPTPPVILEMSPSPASSLKISPAPAAPRTLPGTSRTGG